MSTIEDYYDTSRFSDAHVTMLRKANELGQGFAARAAEHDRNATFAEESAQPLEAAYNE